MKCLFTLEEDKIIREYYPELGSKGCQVFLKNKSKQLINGRASKLKVKTNFIHKIHSNDKKEGVIKDYMNGFNTKTISLKYGVSGDYVRDTLSRCKIRNKKERNGKFDKFKADVELLCDNGSLNYREIGEKLGLTSYQVERIIKKFNINYHHVYFPFKDKINSRGIAGKYNGRHFSSLLELSYMIILERFNIPFDRCEDLGVSVPYIDKDNRERNYFPDFKIKNYIIEIKPNKWQKSRTNLLKFKSCEEYCNKNSFIFKVVDPNVYINKIIEKYNNKELLFTNYFHNRFKSYCKNRNLHIKELI